MPSKFKSKKKNLRVASSTYRRTLEQISTDDILTKYSLGADSERDNLNVLQLYVPNPKFPSSANDVFVVIVFKKFLHTSKYIKQEYSIVALSFLFTLCNVQGIYIPGSSIKPK